MFAIVLQHCPADLVHRLKSRELWSATNVARDSIALTRMMRDVAHAHNNMIQGTMTIVASDMTLYTTYMSNAEMPVAFYHTFQMSVYTVNTHGGFASCHPKLFDEYVTRLMSERGLDKNGDPDKLNMVIRDAEHQSCDKYIRAYIEVPNLSSLDK